MTYGVDGFFLNQIMVLCYITSAPHIDEKTSEVLYYYLKNEGRSKYCQTAALTSASILYSH